MSEEDFPSDQRLPCGRTVGDLLAYHTDGVPTEPNEHIDNCPHCRNQLAEISRRWRPVRHTARSSVVTPDGLVERTLANLRTVRGGHGGDATEIPQEKGTLRIQPSAARTLGRGLCVDVLRDFPGVRLRSCSGDAEEIRADLVVAYPTPVDVLDDIRSRLADSLHEHLGAATPVVSVRLVDVTPPSDHG